MEMARGGPAIFYMGHGGRHLGGRWCQVTAHVRLEHPINQLDSNLMIFGVSSRVKPVTPRVELWQRYVMGVQVWVWASGFGTQVQMDLASVSRSSVGEVQSGLVPGHFCRTGDPTVPSLTQFLGLPWTVYIGLVLVQTGSRQSLHILFIYLFKIEDGGLVWDGTASSSHRLTWCTMQDSVVGSRSTMWSWWLKNNKNGGGIYDIHAHQ